MARCIVESGEMSHVLGRRVYNSLSISLKVRTILSGFLFCNRSLSACHREYHTASALTTLLCRLSRS